MWYVNVIESTTGDVVKSIECSSEKKAEKVCDGVCINLDWDNYETQIEFKGEHSMNTQPHTQYDTLNAALHTIENLISQGFSSFKLYRSYGKVWNVIVNPVQAHSANTLS